MSRELISLKVLSLCYLELICREGVPLEISIITQISFAVVILRIPPPGGIEAMMELVRSNARLKAAFASFSVFSF